MDTTNDELIRARKTALRVVLGESLALDPDAPLGEGDPRWDAGDEPAIWAATDLTLLKPEASIGQIEDLCRRAAEMRAATVCVNSIYIADADEFLKDTDVMPICVVGFPLGSSLPEAVATEARIAVADGAREIDMVFPVGLLKGGEITAARDFVAHVVNMSDAPVKVILETCLLTDEEIIDASLISAAAGAAFVKTSTGFGSDGAKPEHVALMRRAVGDNIGVKASGGIRTFARAAEMLNAGASRIGTSGLS